eukprot:TRINITY_DN12911_c0_g1_i1.p1 TRINITY_DN12911_c0_g1~~TRINITY_DN12911_c0_g1_i1.p1  ORF type:complete len:125 (-),score=6.68 TRINITY_DN12911_c0_g1_i1:31-405(-)
MQFLTIERNMAAPQNTLNWGTTRCVASTKKERNVLEVNTNSKTRQRTTSVHDNACSKASVQLAGTAADTLIPLSLEHPAASHSTACRARSARPRASAVRPQARHPAAAAALRLQQQEDRTEQCH